jgi:hypothetical protein
MQPQVSNTQPLTVYDFACDKEVMVVNNKGEVKRYTNMGINEQVEKKSMCECGGEMYEGECMECGYSEGEMEEGKKFPDLTGDGEVTYADILKGRGVKPKNSKFDKAIKKAKKLHKIEIMKAYSKQSPIEDGVFTSVNKAEQYYNQTFINE